MNATNLTALTERIKKMARLARCPAAKKGEAANAAMMLVKIARINNIKLVGFEDILAMASASDSKPPQPRPRKPHLEPSLKPQYKEPPMPKPPSSKSPDSTPKPSPWRGTKPSDYYQDIPYAEPSASGRRRTTRSRQKSTHSRSTYTEPWYSTPAYMRIVNSITPRAKPNQFEPHTLISIMPDGLYRGKTFEEIFKLDPRYLMWVVIAHPSKNLINASILAFLKSMEPSTGIL